MNVEGTKEMMENMRVYDESSFGAGRIDGRAVASHLWWLLQDVCFRLGRAVLHSLQLLLRHRQATTLAWAKAYLRAVHIEMNVEGTKK